MRQRAIVALTALVLGAVGCSPTASEGDPLDFPGGGGGKADALGRGLVGIASDYEASVLDEQELASDMRRRREVAWQTIEKVLEPVPLFGLAEDAEEHEEIELPDGQVPMIARWQSWYGVGEIKRMFQHLYEDLGPSGRAVRSRFDEDKVADAFIWNSKALDRSTRWPLERYFAYVRSLGLCGEELSDEECAQLVESRFAGAASGNSRILYSPAVATHILRNYSEILDCLDRLDDLMMAAQPELDDNFTTCFATELEINSVLIKAQWQRADFDRPVAAFDTDGTAMRARLSQTAQWPELGDRERQPAPDDIFTIRLRNGDVYRLVGLHIMTKELRHWQWITLWWSDQPTTDFGADRPTSFGDRLPAVWSNYKMCVVGSFEEHDTGAAARFADLPTLADALDATASPTTGSTWCSNPYLEHGRNNAGTNCIGCHQHGGSTSAFDVDGDEVLDQFDLDSVLENETLFPDKGRARIRDVFPADYLYSFNKADDFAHIIESEVSFFDGFDGDSVRARIIAVLELSSNESNGEALFIARCSGCHGPDGHGSGFAPNLEDRVPLRDDEALLQTLISGRGGMPSWGTELSNQELADVRGFLRASFGAP